MCACVFVLCSNSRSWCQFSLNHSHFAWTEIFLARRKWEKKSSFFFSIEKWNDRLFAFLSLLSKDFFIWFNICFVPTQHYAVGNSTLRNCSDFFFTSFLILLFNVLVLLERLLLLFILSYYIYSSFFSFEKKLYHRPFFPKRLHDAEEKHSRRIKLELFYLSL